MCGHPAPPVCAILRRVVSPASNGRLSEHAARKGSQPMPSVLRPLLISASRSERAEHLVRSSSFTQSLVTRFVAGEAFADARAAAERLGTRGLLVTYDHLGESVTDEGAVRRMIAEYQGYFAQAPRASHFSLKLS